MGKTGAVILAAAVGWSLRSYVCHNQLQKSADECGVKIRAEMSSHQADLESCLAAIKNKTSR